MNEREPVCRCGTCSRCKNRAAVMRYQERNREKVRERDRERHRQKYATDPEYRANKAAKDAKRYHENPKERDRVRKKLKSMRTPESHRAVQAVQYALKTGRLVRPDHCEDCGKRCKPDASHDDYERRLDVRWRCRSCHIKYDMRRKGLKVVG